jgi:hypothetical protein
VAEINDWDVTDANNNAAPPDGWPENTMNYSEVNDTGRAVQGKIKRFFADINGSLVATGTANTYAVTLNAGYAAYFDGLFFAASIPATNTGGSTINVNSLGAKSIVDCGGNALAGGELVSDGTYSFYYDGTNMVAVNVKSVYENSLSVNRATVERYILFTDNGADPIGFYGASAATSYNVGLYDYKNSSGIFDYTEATQTLNVGAPTFTFNGVGVTTVSGTQTLTNKTLTAPVLTTPTVTSPTVNGVLAGTTIQVGRVNAAGTTVSQSGSITSSLIGTGIYRLTHNLGHTDYTLAASSEDGSSGVYATPDDPQLNYIDVYVRLDAFTLAASAFSYQLIQY